jgi:predicted DsbA family dithiol-disulfide isomerase
LKLRQTQFPLHPDTPKEGLSLAKLFAGRGVDLAAMYARMKRLLEAEGLPYGKREKTFNSRLAQELGKYGDERGVAKIHDEIYRAYFVDGVNIAEMDVLLDIASRVGLPAAEVKLVLTEGRMRAAVDADWARSRALGITGVPTFVINGQRLVGAQPYDVLEEFALSAGVRPADDSDYQER